MKRFEVHSHTHYSNLRLLDCINRPKDLINRAIELGLSGITITDHEALCGHMEINQYAKEKLGLGDDETEDLTFSSNNISAVLEGMRSVTEEGGTASSVFRNFDIELL